MKSPLLLVIAALVAPARAQTLYTVDQASQQLSTVDPTTGALATVGPLGVAFSFGDLAFDTSTATLFMSDGWGSDPNQPSSLYRVDLQTGAATLVGSTGVLGLFGLVYVPSSDKLYGSAAVSSTGFYELDRTTGAASFIGQPGGNIDGMTLVNGTTIVGIRAGGQGPLFTIDPVTGAGTFITSQGFVDDCGIAWLQATNKVYAIDISGDFYAYDVANGYTRTLVASNFVSCDGLAVVLPICSSGSTYCTAGTTTHGCVPSIGSSGTPSVSAASGFTLSLSNVEGQKSGIFFYGVSGPLIQPWAGGSTSFLCVKPPTQRMLTQSTGGTANACNGSMSIDWRAFLSAHPSALGQPIASGQQFVSQAWFRDPPAPKSTNLSNALQWVTCP